MILTSQKKKRDQQFFQAEGHSFWQWHRKSIEKDPTFSNNLNNQTFFFQADFKDGYDDYVILTPKWFQSVKGDQELLEIPRKFHGHYLFSAGKNYGKCLKTGQYRDNRQDTSMGHLRFWDSKIWLTDMITA